MNFNRQDFEIVMYCILLHFSDFFPFFSEGMLLTNFFNKIPRRFFGQYFVVTNYFCIEKGNRLRWLCGLLVKIYKYASPRHIFWLQMSQGPIRSLKEQTILLQS